MKKRKQSNQIFGIQNRRLKKKGNKFLGSEIIPFGVGVLVGAALVGAAAGATNN